jgi:hypothetical protein
LPAVLGYAQCTMNSLSPIIAELFVAFIIFISSMVVMQYLSNFACVVSAMFSILVMSSLSYTCPGNHVCFSTHCPPVFSMLTLCIYSFISHEVLYQPHCHHAENRKMYHPALIYVFSWHSSKKTIW